MANANGTVATSTPQQIANVAQALNLPADGRTANAIDLVLAGKVELHADSATVQGGTSQAPNAYVVGDDACPCYDSQHSPQPDGCKHVRAVKLAAAMAKLNRPISEFDHAEPSALADVWGDEPTYCDPEPSSNGTTAVEVEDPPVAALEPVVTPHWSETDAPYIQTVRWTDRSSGVEFVTVIRADTWDELLPKIAQVSKVAKAHREVPEAGSPEAEALANDPAYCSVHGEQMKASTDGKGFYHKAGEKADGKAVWCRGK